MPIKENQVSGLYLAPSDSSANFDLIPGVSRQTNTESSIHCPHQTGTIKASRSNTAPQVGHSQKPTRFSDYGRSRCNRLHCSLYRHQMAALDIQLRATDWAEQISQATTGSAYRKSGTVEYKVRRQTTLSFVVEPGSARLHNMVAGSEPSMIIGMSDLGQETSIRPTGVSIGLYNSYISLAATAYFQHFSKQRLIDPFAVELGLGPQIEHICLYNTVSHVVVYSRRQRPSNKKRGPDITPDPLRALVRLQEAS